MLSGSASAQAGQSFPTDRVPVLLGHRRGIATVQRRKDLYVFKALAAIPAADMALLQRVFGGGPALSWAHRLIRRMSEDIDLKIVGDEEPTRPALRRLRMPINLRDQRT